jgi:hypothetical protein
MSWHRDPLALATPIGEHADHDYSSATSATIQQDQPENVEVEDTTHFTPHNESSPSEDATVAGTPERVSSEADATHHDNDGKKGKALVSESDSGSEVVEGSGSSGRGDGKSA